MQWIRGELIGKGSFGRVYHALNVEAGEWIAVKQVDLPVTKADYANPQLLETKDSLFREISLLEDLDNEYIVQYLGYNVDLEEGHINIFLEYVPGGSIASCLAKTGKFDGPLVQFFTRQILMGLAYLHNRNVLHRVSYHIHIHVLPANLFIFFIRILKLVISFWIKTVFVKLLILVCPN